MYMGEVLCTVQTIGLGQDAHWFGLFVGLLWEVGGGSSWLAPGSQAVWRMVAHTLDRGMAISRLLLQTLQTLHSSLSTGSALDVLQIGPEQPVRSQGQHMTAFETSPSIPRFQPLLLGDFATTQFMHYTHIISCHSDVGQTDVLGRKNCGDDLPGISIEVDDFPHPPDLLDGICGPLICLGPSALVQGENCR